MSSQNEWEKSKDKAKITSSDELLISTLLPKKIRKLILDCSKDEDSVFKHNEEEDQQTAQFIGQDEELEAKDLGITIEEVRRRKHVQTKNWKAQRLKEERKTTYAETDECVPFPYF